MTPLPLHGLHQANGARFGELGGQELVQNYGSSEAEYLKLTTSAGALDLSFRGRICVLGNDRVKFLHGQITNDVARLKTGQGCYAGLISAKGKLQSDLFVFMLKDEILLDFEPGLTSRIIERLQHYIIADDVQLVDVSEPYGLITVQGPGAREMLQAANFEQLPEQPLAWTSQQLPEGDLYVMNNPRLATSGFDLYIPAEAMERVANLFQSNWCGWDAFEIARIEAAIPRFGIDMTEANLAPEAEIQDRAISYSKGCYIGQEVIARIRTYGKVAKALRLIRLPDEMETLPEQGHKLFKDGKEAGYICSSTLSPKHDAKVALAYIRKECNAPGETLHTDPAGGGQAQVLSVPGT